MSDPSSSRVPFDNGDLKRALEIAVKVAPKNNPEFSCMLVAAAVAGLRGFGMRNIRIGALFYPEKFKDDPYLSMRGGWGCEGYSKIDSRLYLADEGIDDDGGFSGHTWVEPEPDSVLDLMHGVEEGAREVYDADWKIVGRYIPRPRLERAVKAHWRTEMTAAIKAGKAMAVELAADSPAPR